MGASPAVGTTRFTTAGVSTAERVRRWEAWNAAALLGLRATPTRGTVLDATQVARRLPGARLARVHASAHAVTRGPADVAATPTAAVAVFLPLGATGHVETGPTTTSLGRGALLVLDADRPFRREFPGGVDELVLAVPGPAGPVPATPVRLDLDGRRASPAAVALAADLTAGADAAWRLGPAVAALLRELAGDPRPPSRIDLARSFVAHRLTHPSLSAATIAAALGVSERQLSRTFAAVGSSVPAEVLEQRLQRARIVLEREPGTSPAAVARRVGITSASHFSRRFTARFGTTPGRWPPG